MYIQGVDSFFDLNWNGGEGAEKLTYGDVFLKNEREFSAYNFEAANTEVLLRQFADAEASCVMLLEKQLVLPAYDHCIKASHLFNVLNARGVISVTERASYIGRVRNLAKACCSLWVEQQEVAHG